jgi:heme/copper-type cytochrome/quinol oxidase subunit 4
MSEEPPIVKTVDEARQGVRVKGMTTVLIVSIILAAIAVAVIAVIVASGSSVGGS